MELNGFPNQVTRKRLWYKRGRALALLTLGACIIATGLINLHKFLAITNPTKKGVLIVEAWIPSETVAESVEVFRSGSYSHLVLVGSNERSPKDQLGRSSVGRAADVIRSCGLDPSKLVVIEVPPQTKNRTFATALAAGKWLKDSARSVHEVDVFTVGVHARKSWILFRYALGKDYRTGIISGAEPSYNASSWLVSKRGMWIVIRNLSGYIYYKLWIVTRELFGVSGD